MRYAFALFAALAAAPPAQGCDLALVLAVDVSGSVDAHEYRVQMDGLAAALRDGVVAEALVRAQAEVMLVQWTGATRQRVTLPWAAMSDFGAVEAFADAVAGDPRVWRNYSTAVGEALIFSLGQFAQVPHCTRYVIDVSGDGRNNEGVSPAGQHPALKEAGVVVNAIAIEESEQDLTDYFFENVIVGDGAFVETAATFEEYPARIRRKLLREIIQQTAQLPAEPSARPVMLPRD
jgi:Ca-activated chloride channel family protein